MRKFVAVCLVMGMVLLIAGCSSGSSSTQNNTSTQNTSTQNTTGKTQNITKDNSTVKNGKIIYYKNLQKWDKVNVQYYNSNTPSQIMYKEMTVKDKAEDRRDTYTSAIDLAKYDMIQFSNGKDICSLAVPVTKFSSGYSPDAGTLKQPITGCFTYGEEPDSTVKFTTVNLPYANKVKSKNIYIWTPKTYNKADLTTKYSVIYMSDGQNIFQNTSRNWSVPQSVSSVIANGGNNIIVVGIDNSDKNRDSELTPNLGKVVPSYQAEFNNNTGNVFSDFVVKTVMPYINKNYNTYTDKGHTGICGSSSGGLESFYIGMEHMDKFGYIGAFSPAFMLFDNNVWKTYLSAKKLSEAPYLYVYSGNNDSLEREILPSSVSMVNSLKNMGYDESKLNFSVCESGIHTETYWRAFFPEFIQLMG